jgi:rubrerythrin
MILVDPALLHLEAQVQESAEHADTFRRAAHRFGLLEAVEHHHADRYNVGFIITSP